MKPPARWSARHRGERSKRLTAHEIESQLPCPTLVCLRGLLRMGAEIEIGPTGKKLLPLTMLGSGRQELLEHQH